MARQRLTSELTGAILRAEKRLGRVRDRPELARRLNISTASLYAYLNGTTLPRSQTFERILDEMDITGAERGRLCTLRDAAEVAQRVWRGRDVPARRLGDGGGRLPRPRQLPAHSRHFVGRDAELAELNGTLDGRGTTAGTVVITAIDGSAGVGKTALAVHWAHQIKDRYPDGQLYVNLRGFDLQAPADPGQVLHGFLHALGIPAACIPADLDAMAALYRSLLAERRVLVVLDNAASADHVRPLLPGASTCMAIITSRGRLDGLAVREGAHRVELDVLPPPDAWDLLAGYLTQRRLEAEPVAARDLIELCARLPLALSITAARSAGRSDEPLTTMVGELRDAHARLDHLDLGESDLDVRTVFHWSYGRLPPEAARLFRLLGLHPGPDIDSAACAALLAVPTSPTALLKELTRAHLLTEQPAGRFRFHDLLRAYAREQAERDEPEHARAEAMRRVLERYLGAASLANTYLQPGGASKADPAPAAVRSAPPISGYAAAMAWFDAEWAVLRSVISYAAAHGFEPWAWRLAWACTVFLRRTGRREERASVHRAATAAARRCGDLSSQATSLRLLADAVARLGRTREALGLLHEALRCFGDLGDAIGEGQTHLSFARVYEAEHRHAEALEHAERALSLAMRGDDPCGHADGLTATGRQLALLGRHAEALPLSRRALDLYSELGHLEGQADVLLNLGYLEHRLGRPRRAVACFGQSLELDRRLGDRFWEAHALDHLADAHVDLGERRRARELRERALAVLEALHHPDAEPVRAKLTAPAGTA